MSKTLDFNTYKKSYLTVILPDKEKTTLFVTSPTLQMKKAVVSLVERIESLKDLSTYELAKTDITDEIYELSAILLNKNQNGIEITKDYIQTILDDEDVNVFLYEYLHYLMGIENEKN